MTERDLKALEKNLRTALVKSPALFSWNDSWQLLSKRVEIPEAKIKEIAAEFEQTRASASTEELVKKLFGLEASNDLFDITCMSLELRARQEAQEGLRLPVPRRLGPSGTSRRSSTPCPRACPSRPRSPSSPSSWSSRSPR